MTPLYHLRVSATDGKEYTFFIRVPEESEVEPVIAKALTSPNTWIDVATLEGEQRMLRATAVVSWRVQGITP